MAFAGIFHAEVSQGEDSMKSIATEWPFHPPMGLIVTYFQVPHFEQGASGAVACSDEYGGCGGPCTTYG